MSVFATLPVCLPAASQPWPCQLPSPILTPPLCRARAVRHVGLLSRYLVGGVSERMYREFWLEKERFTIDELGLLRASPILAKDVMKAMRFYGAKMLRAVRHAS